MSRPTRSLTGIKPTGSPHLGNYYGAIKPALELAADGSLECFYFIADYHALTTFDEPGSLGRLTYDVTATWIACGLDPARVTIYRQSDIPEIFELAWILSCFTSKGWMNKAHAYKAAVQANEEAGLAGDDLDAGVNMGLYNYPVLMAADILMFDSDVVPVGKDQVQHIEIARDIAQRVNHAVGGGDEVLRVPAAKVDERTAILPGLDGRKMSKSYGNTIPLFGTSKELKKAVNRIVTDSTPPEAPKDPDASVVYQLHKQVAAPDASEALAARLRQGIGWGEAKGALFEVLDAELGPRRERYQALMADPQRELEPILLAGADKARAVARRTLDRVRSAIGVRTRGGG